MEIRRVLARFTSLVLAMALASQPAWAGLPQATCAVGLGGDPLPLLEQVFNQEYAGRMSVSGQNAFAFMRHRISQRILEKCKAGCTDEELASLIKNELENLLRLTGKVDKASHRLGGWIVLAASLIGLSTGSYFLVNHAPPELSSSITVFASIIAAMLLNPVTSTAAASAYRGLYRAIAFGLPFVRHDAMTQALDYQSRIVRAKQTPLEVTEVGRIMQAVSFAGSRLKEAADLIDSDKKTGPGRAVTNLATIAILMHKYFPELNPSESNDVTGMVREMFTQWLPSRWTSPEKRAELVEMILTEIKNHDPTIHDLRDEYYYRLLVGNWMAEAPPNSSAPL